MKPSEQFSQEYIDYILSDEGKALQQGREFGIGDWYIPGLNKPNLQLIKNRLDLSCRGVNWIKLFTLWDLLQIIEGAGYWWALGRNFDLAETEPYWYDASAGRIDVDGYLSDIESKNVMLAAAKLAVRAFES